MSPDMSAVGRAALGRRLHNAPGPLPSTRKQRSIPRDPDTSQEARFLGGLVHQVVTAEPPSWITWPFSITGLARGVDNGIMSRPPVRLEIRAGDGCSFLLEENEWPIARTNYTRYHLDASPSEWNGDAWRSDFLRLSPVEPVETRSVSYSAEIPLESRAGPSSALLRR